MTLRTARHWLGIYFLVVSVFVGGFLLVFSGTPILPLTSDEARSSFEIIVPVLVGQMALVFQWLSTASQNVIEDDRPCPIPDWAIVLPPILAMLIFIVGVVTLALSNEPKASLKVSPSTFQGVVTFTVTILNASTIVLVGKLFPATRDLGDARAAPPRSKRRSAPTAPPSPNTRASARRSTEP